MNVTATPTDAGIKYNLEGTEVFQIGWERPTALPKVLPNGVVVTEAMLTELQAAFDTLEKNSQ